MPTLKIKYVKESEVDRGRTIEIAPMSVRLHLDQPALKATLLESLNKGTDIYYTEEKCFSSTPYPKIQSDIRKNDSGSIQIPIAPPRISALGTLRRFINKHSDLIVEIDKNSAERERLTQLLTKAGIKLGALEAKAAPAPAAPATIIVDRTGLSVGFHVNNEAIKKNLVIAFQTQNIAVYQDRENPSCIFEAADIKGPVPKSFAVFTDFALVNPDIVVNFYNHAKYSLEITHLIKLFEEARIADYSRKILRLRQERDSSRQEIDRLLISLQNRSYQPTAGESKSVAPHIVPAAGAMSSSAANDEKSTLLVASIFNNKSAASQSAELEKTSYGILLMGIGLILGGITLYLKPETRNDDIAQMRIMVPLMLLGLVLGAALDLRNACNKVNHRQPK